MDIEEQVEEYINSRSFNDFRADLIRSDNTEGRHSGAYDAALEDAASHLEDLFHIMSDECWSDIEVEEFIRVQVLG